MPSVRPVDSLVQRLIAAADVEPLIGASGHFSPASGHFCELVSS